MMIVSAKGNLDLAVSEGCCLDPFDTVSFLRFAPGATSVTADTPFPPFGTNPQVAEDASGHIYLVWNATPPNDSSRPDVTGFPEGLFSRSDDGGASFTTPVTLFTSGGFPHITLDSSGDIFVSWIGTSSTVSSNAVFVSRSTDGGKTFIASPPISDLFKKATAPYIAMDSKGNIDVIWQYNNTGQNCDSSNVFRSCSPCDIWFAQSADAGKSFSTPINVSNSSGCAGLDGLYKDEQQMQIDSSGNVNVIWDDSVAGVMFSRSADGGKTFSLPTIVSPSQGVYPKVAVDASGGIDVIWAPADDSAALLFSRSTDGGAMFSQPKSMGAGANLDNPQLAIDASGDLDVLWVETHHIQFSQSSDGGASFSSPISISTDTTDFSDVSPDIDPFFTHVHMAVESNGDVDLAFATDQYAGNDKNYLWFSHGSTSAVPRPSPLLLSVFAAPGTVGKSYDGNTTPSGGTPPYSVTATGLPPGLFLQDASTNGWFWYILGTPTTLGNFSASFEVKDSTGMSATNTVTLTIAASGSSIVSSRH